MTPTTAEITAQAVYAAAQEALARIAASVERLAHVYPMSNNPYWGLQGEIAAEAAGLPGGSPPADAIGAKGMTEEHLRYIRTRAAQYPEAALDDVRALLAEVDRLRAEIAARDADNEAFVQGAINIMNNLESS